MQTPYVWRPVDGSAAGPRPLHPLWDIPSGCCFFTGPWTVTQSSLCVLRRVAAFCRPLRRVLLLVSFPRSRSPVIGVPGLCWMWLDVPFGRQRRSVVGVLRLYWLLWGSLDCFCYEHTAVLRPSITCPLPPPPPHLEGNCGGHGYLNWSFRELHLGLGHHKARSCNAPLPAHPHQDYP